MEARSIFRNGTLLSLGWANAASSQPAKCPFIYDKNTRETLVEPALREKEGELWSSYDLDNPGVTFDGDRVALIFGQKDPSVLDSPMFIVKIDACRNAVLSTYETSPFPSTPGPR